MDRKLLALASSLLLLGATATAAFAQDARYAYPDPLFANGDADYDNIPNAEDPVDDRYDEAGNPVRFEVGETLPADSWGNGTLVTDMKRYNLLRPAPSGTAWHHMGKNFYLVELSTGRVADAIYNYITD